MCGIAGQLNYARGERVDPDVIRRMTRSISHRGPDDEGYLMSGGLGLGFRRLSIIDLAGGHQPMADVEETVWIVFNGEIYNFKELRAELEQRGHKFRTRSDTEVIIHGYKEWGTGVFERLNGMFGVAIWDAKRRRLVVARDAMGIKLVYYRNVDGQLTFGSEIRAVLAAGEAAPDVDPVALDLFLKFRYTPSPMTVFRGIRKLAPGTMLVRRGRQMPRGALVRLHAGAFRQPQARRGGRQRAARSLSGRRSTAPAERCAGRHAAQRRPRLGPAAGAHERARRRMAGVHRRLRRELRGR